MVEEYLVDRGDYYEIINCQPKVTFDESGNVTSVIYCPYIPKAFVDVVNKREGILSS